MSPVSAGGRRNVQGLPKYYARVAWSLVLVISGFSENDMPDPDDEKLTEIDAELLQRERLFEMFHRIETYDARESVISFCEKLTQQKRE